MKLLTETLEDGTIQNWYDSSNIPKTFYYPKTNKLYIFFKNGLVYSYDNIDSELYSEFENNESQGQFFIDTIKSNENKYPFKRMFKLKNFEIDEINNKINKLNENNGTEHNLN